MCWTRTEPKPRWKTGTGMGFIGWKESSDHSYKRKRRYVVGDVNYTAVGTKSTQTLRRSVETGGETQNSNTFGAEQPRV